MNANKEIEKIATALINYSEDVEKLLEESKQKVAKEVLNSLKNNKKIPSKTGTYKRSFYQKKIKTSTGVNYIIANKRYMLTHLLEYGHKIVKNKIVITTTKAYPHWKQAQTIAEKLVNQVVKGIEKL